jgi:hypothetical protein
LISRRDLVLGVPAAVIMAETAIAAPRKRKKRVADDVLYYDKGINVPNLQRCWPDGHDMPQLIADIGTMLKGEVWGSVGYVEMPGSRFNDYWVEGGADLWPQFGMFAHLPDGTEIAIWYHDGAVPGAEPVVEIGSEGDLQILAPNLKSFFRDWAKDNGHHSMTLDEEDRTPERLARWKNVAAKMNAIIDAAPDHPPGAPTQDIEGFITQFGESSRAAMRANPLHQAIAKVMDAHVPRGKAAYEYYNCQIYIAGNRIEFLPNATPPDYKVRAALPEVAELTPLILQAREARAQGIHAVRGLWHCASLRISPDGLVNLPADWDAKPDFESGAKVTRADVEADLARFPRSPRWHMPWMDELA